MSLPVMGEGEKETDAVKYLNHVGNFLWITNPFTEKITQPSAAAFDVGPCPGAPVRSALLPIVYSLCREAASRALHPPAWATALLS